MSYFVNKIFEFGPQAIEAYPSAIYVLAKYMDDNNIRHKIKAVFTSSETLYPIQREVIERVFQCKIYDKYGLSEMFLLLLNVNNIKDFILIWSMPLLNS